MGVLDQLKDLWDKWLLTLGDKGQAAADDAATAAIATTESTEGLELKFVSDPALIGAVRRAIEAFAQRSGLDDTACQEIGLVMNEALANVIRHAYQGSVDRPVLVEARNLQPGVGICIRDWGNGLDPSALPTPQYDPLTPGGLGLICMKQLMDGLSYRPQVDGMLLEMTRTTSGSRSCLRRGE